MSTNQFLSSRMMMGAALVGLVGAAGMYLYEQLYAEKRRAMLARDMARLDSQVASMRLELEALRDLQKQNSKNRTKQKKRMERRPKPAKIDASGDHVDGEVSYASDTDYYTDYQSIAGTDAELDSEEFYDVHSDEDDTLREANGFGSDGGEDLSSRSNSTRSPKKEKKVV